MTVTTNPNVATSNTNVAALITPEAYGNIHAEVARLPQAQTSRIENDPLAGLENNVSPEAIMHMLQIRMRDFDSEIGTRLDEIRTHQRDSKRLSSDLDVLNQFQTNFVAANGDIATSKTITPAREQYPELLEQVNRAMETAPPGAGRDALGALHAALTCGGEAPVTISFNAFRALHADLKLPDSGKASDTVGTQIAKVKDQLQTLNTGNDLRMTQLQSTLQQRTALIQMGSNLLKSLDEASRAIINNMR